MAPSELLASFYAFFLYTERVSVRIRLHSMVDCLRGIGIEFTVLSLHCHECGATKLAEHVQPVQGGEKNNDQQRETKRGA